MNQISNIPLHPKATALIADITQLMDEAEQMLNESTSQHAEGQVQLIREQCGDLRMRIEDFFSGTGKKIAASAHRTDRAIRAHPYKSIAIALGIGALLGAWYARRDS